MDGRGTSATIHCDQKDCEHRKDGLCTSVLVEVQSQECMTYAYVGGYEEEEEE